MPRAPVEFTAPACRRLLLDGATTLLVASVLASAAAAAMATGVHKCVDAAGAVLYSGVACSSSHQAVAATLPPLNVVTGTAVPPRTVPAAGARPSVPVAGTRRSGESRTPVLRIAAPAAARHSDREIGERRFVSIGMSDVEVIARLGRPDRVLRGSLSARGGRGGRPAIVRWVYLPVIADSYTITVVEIDAGMVVDVERRIQR